MNITTEYKTNGNGTGQILAKGGGKQRTINYNQEKSPEWNHGNAAGVLAQALGKTAADGRNATHTDLGLGKRRFSL